MIKIAISRCLLGEAVRYDATAKYCALIEHFKKYEIVPFCPEVAIGMGIPRPPIQLEIVKDKVLARRREGEKIDYTTQLQHFAEKFVDTHPDLVAIINKRSSPSCGYQSCKLFQDDQLIHQRADGIFIATVLARLPGVYLIDEEALERPEDRNEFELYLKQKALQEQGF